MHDIRLLNEWLDHCVCIELGGWMIVCLLKSAFGKLFWCILVIFNRIRRDFNAENRCDHLILAQATLGGGESLARKELIARLHELSVHQDRLEHVVILHPMVGHLI